jgi:hypothetical protein
MIKLVFPAVVVISALTIGGCGGSSSAPSPTTTTTNIAGIWTGTFLDNLLGPNQTTWSVQQSGSSMTGSFAVQAPAATGQGTIQGSISGSSLSVTGTIRAGGYPSPFQNCTQTATGTLQIQGSRMSGPYTLQLGSGCIPPNLNTAGTLTLNRQ